MSPDAPSPGKYILLHFSLRVPALEDDEFTTQERGNVSIAPEQLPAIHFLFEVSVSIAMKDVQIHKHLRSRGECHNLLQPGIDHASKDRTRPFKMILLP